jgi:hypothetical protein
MTGLLDLEHCLKRLMGSAKRIQATIDARHDGALAAFPQTFETEVTFVEAVAAAYRDLADMPGWRNSLFYVSTSARKALARIETAYGSWGTAWRCCSDSLEGGRSALWRRIVAVVRDAMIDAEVDKILAEYSRSLAQVENKSALTSAYLVTYGHLLPPDVIQNLPTWSADAFVRYLRKHAAFFGRATRS